MQCRSGYIGRDAHLECSTACDNGQPGGDGVLPAEDLEAYGADFSAATDVHYFSLPGRNKAGYPTLAARASSIDSYLSRETQSTQVCAPHVGRAD
jgi:hypothetical protein